MNDLTPALERLASDSPGHYGVTVRDVASGRSFVWHADEGFPSASIIKLPIMAEVYRQAHLRLLSLGDNVWVTPEDIASGSGVLHLFTPNLQLQVRDLVELMICVSDNTATNMLLDRVGIRHVNEYMEVLGLKHTRVYNNLQVFPIPRTGVNQTSPSDMVELLARIATGNVVSGWACHRMIDTLKRQQFNDIIPGHLPIEQPSTIGGRPTIEVAHKSGWYSGVRGDVGLIYHGSRCLAVAVLGRDLTNDETSSGVLSRMARLLYDWGMSSEVDDTNPDQASD